MSRWVIAIALTWSAWAVQQPAVALARSTFSSELGPAMCGEGALTVLFDELTPGRPLTLGPQQSTPTREGDEDQGTLRTSANPALTQDDAPPAWCFSPDDPRCAPRDQSAPSQAPRGQVPMQDAAAMPRPELAAVSGVEKLRSLPLGAVRAGVGMQLERPPRC